MKLSENLSCMECGTKIKSVPTTLEYEGEEIFVFDPVVCKSCLEKLCENYSTQCANCGGTIPPYSNVGILKAENGKVVIAAIDGELTVKRYKKNGNNITLEAENDSYESITFDKKNEAYIWGIVTNVIHNL